MYIRRSSVLASFDQMNKYLHITKSAIDETANDFFATVKRLRASTSDEKEKQEFADLFHDEFVEVNYEFPRMLYSSFLVAWYSFIEHNLILLCDDFYLAKNIGVQERDEFGTGIQRARRILKEAAKFEIPDHYWQELTKIRQIRNNIVHKSGELNYFMTEPTNEKTIPLHLDAIYENDPEILYLQIEANLFQYLDENALFRYDGHLYIDLTFEYCLGLVDIGKGLFAEIWEGLGLK